MGISTIDWTLEKLADSMERDDFFSPPINWFEVAGTTRQDWIARHMAAFNREVSGLFQSP